LTDQAVSDRSRCDVVPDVSYDVLAGEYYDSNAHPTCHNLNRLSRAYLARWIPEHFRCRDILEVGAGNSVVASILHERGLPLTGLELQDASESMLAHSRRWHTLGASTIISDARSISRTDATVSLLVASLGDPYNVSAYWAEAARVVRPGGRALFTMPSFQWAARFRALQEGDSLQVAKFVLRDGRIVDVPSYIYPLTEQVRMIEAAGFMLVQFDSLGVDALSGEDYRSPKVDVFGPDVSSLVWGFVAVRLHAPIEAAILERWPTSPA
jgi:ubiquinone/menaquinone biosynthesis C-methylase UbiE